MGFFGPEDLRVIIFCHSPVTYWSTPHTMNGAAGSRIFVTVFKLGIHSGLCGEGRRTVDCPIRSNFALLNTAKLCSHHYSSLTNCISIPTPLIIRPLPTARKSMACDQCSWRRTFLNSCGPIYAGIRSQLLVRPWQSTGVKLILALGTSRDAFKLRQITQNCGKIQLSAR